MLQIIRYTILISSILVSGCKDLTFGDTAKSYLVEGNAVADAGVFIEQDLTYRWNNSFRIFFNNYMAKNQHLLDLMNSIQIAPLPDGAALEDMNEQQLKSEIRDLQNLKKLLQGAQSNLHLIEQGLNQFAGICKNVGFVRSLEMDHTFLRHFASMGLPNIDDIFEFNVTYGSWENIPHFLDFIGFLTKKKEYKEQVKKLNESFEHFRQRVIQGDEFYTLSSHICNRDKTRFDVAFQSLSETMQKLSTHIWLKSEKLDSTTLIYQAYLTPIIYQKIEDIFGNRELLASFEEANFYSLLNQQFNSERDRFGAKLLALALLSRANLKTDYGREAIYATHESALLMVIDLKRLLGLDLRSTEREVYELTLKHFISTLESLEGLRNENR